MGREPTLKGVQDLLEAGCDRGHASYAEAERLLEVNTRKSFRSKIQDRRSRAVNVIETLMVSGIRIRQSPAWLPARCYA